MDRLAFEKFDGVKIDTKQPFITKGARVPKLLHDEKVSRRLVGQIVPVYNARDAIDMRDPGRVDRAIGFALVKDNLELQLKIMHKPTQKLLQQYKGKKFDIWFKLVPAGTVKSGGQEFTLDHIKMYVKPIPGKDDIVLEETTEEKEPEPETAQSEPALLDVLTDELVIDKGEVFMGNFDGFQGMLRKAFGQGRHLVNVEVNKGVVRIVER